MPITVLRNHIGTIGTALRTAARRISENRAVIWLEARLGGHSIPRLAITAVFAYLAAKMLPGSSQPVLAPLTALLVVQATRYQTVRSAFQRVAAVVAGVLIALALTAAVGFTWWSLGIIIVIALVIGAVLHLGSQLLEVPISAMLILSLGSGVAATGRVVDTLVGAVVGLIGGMVFARVRTQPAEEAIEGLSEQMAELLEEIASGLTTGRGTGEQTAAWLSRARSLGGEIQEVEETLGEAEESLRLTPRALRSDLTAAPLRNGLEVLELATTTIRGLTRSITDDAKLPETDATGLAAETPDKLANVLWRLAPAVRAYGSLIRADLSDSDDLDGSGLDQHLDEAREQRDLLALMLEHSPEPAAPGWRLRGEMLVHLDRLTSALQVEQLARERHDPHSPAWLQAVRAVQAPAGEQEGPAWKRAVRAVRSHGPGGPGPHGPGGPGSHAAPGDASDAEHAKVFSHSD